jgi:hypothetical protein
VTGRVLKVNARYWHTFSSG